MPVPRSKLSRFILSLPASMTGAEVIERAMARGWKTSKSNVSRVRSRFRTSPKRSKAAFVRAHPNLSAHEVAREAAASGLNFDAEYVYNVRGYDRKMLSERQGEGKKAPSSKPAVTKPKATVATLMPVASNGFRPSGSASSLEDLLRAAAAELGLARAVEILEGERARVRKVLGGP